ncbi:ABC transporter ATP-binding protein [Chloracidobacterium thermophilum]|uniref:ABC-type polysaccharide/polyol phosphate transport system, ATPase component n=1 Tax=Chloracidobacterium thermophilum (strain B) TaxID=981222 RepID=G2LIA6_CHLTF|nr:ABC transporter ATP-binding protein [Chloracidobacterium thermophilum]AEP11564.1 ABC-type polysaccharide/polyol phosphate transport system, ATPase component [Chloracidobacterium thermophilum B]QUV79451.1 ABC transporter ATP-binding protein [Chloracidobacterium thermophilum]
MTVAIHVEHLSKTFKRYQPRRYRTLKESIINGEMFERRLSERIEAVKDVSFSVAAGETFGIIGRNGAGKSTLLKLLCGILKPTTGRIAVRGRVAALLSLGVGFHEQMSGRENVFLNGLVLGLSPREIRARFDDIVTFAELEDFIDAPVWTYSTGMRMRLAFSVAVNVDPDVLIIDEVLAVGDIAFTEKCLERMRMFQEKGRTLLLVTHDTATLAAWCQRALWLDQGQVRALGDPAEVAQAYLSAFSESVAVPAMNAVA